MQYQALEYGSLGPKLHRAGSFIEHRFDYSFSRDTRTWKVRLHDRPEIIVAEKTVLVSLDEQGKPTFDTVVSSSFERFRPVRTSGYRGRHFSFAS